MNTSLLTFVERVCTSTKMALQLLGTALVLLISVPLMAQTSQGTIQGAIFDQSGAVIPSATVIVIDVARGIIEYHII